MDRLRKRSEFKAAAKGRRINRPGFALQMAPGDPGAGPRFGFTVTKKVGNAVVRNRIRRRLREAVRLAALQKAEPATNYVVIAREAALTRPFPELVADLQSGLTALAAGKATGRRDG